MASSVNGGQFGQGFGLSSITTAAALGYTSLVGYDAKAGPGSNPEEPFYKPVAEPLSNDYGRQPVVTFGNNVIGYNGPGNLCSQGTFCSRALNLIPFINATAGFHDYIFNARLLEQSWLTNLGTMLPAAGLAIPAALDDRTINWQISRKKRRGSHD